ncbi:hypothetical protein ABZT47_31790 [Sphaerisporangium sp. NPDC005289]|uniref:hypothetical protein n=1 Tax=Sphaerisporangium sp. NPDC005289 TaxID=3155247 RepID=UPI0033BCDDF0
MLRNDTTGRVEYVGITNNAKKRAYQHGKRFNNHTFEIVTRGLTRGQARAIEETVYMRNKLSGVSELRNRIHSINPKHPYYRRMLQWGEWWLRMNKPNL